MIEFETAKIDSKSFFVIIFFECGNKFITVNAYGEVQRNGVECVTIVETEKRMSYSSISYQWYLLFSCVLTPNTPNVEHTTFCDECVVRESSQKKIFIDSWLKILCRILLNKLGKIISSTPPPIHTFFKPLTPMQFLRIFIKQITQKNLFSLSFVDY